ncbi:hypothetical protein F5X96DRAFT_595630 [Biscogniauxia mediterranea]|nr:hypothetical protein F5X96DRAFT_595630 [Biscogniauxia mediterranea]
MEQPAVEILVHIAAPSRTVDDAKYRSLASAYIDFEPVTHLSFPEHAPEPAPIHALPDTSSSLHRSLDLQQPGSFDHDHDDHQTPRSSGPLGSLKSPYASFRSVIDNSNSPLLRLGDGQVRVEATQLQQPATQSTQSSWQSPPSVVGDSQHAIPVAVVSSPTRVLEHYLQSFADSPQPHVRSSNESGSVVISNTPARPSDASLQPRYQTRQYPSTPSVPNTPLGEKTTEAPDHQGEGSEERKTHNEINRRLPSVDGPEDHAIVESSVLVPPPGTHPVARADSEPTPGQRPGGQALVRTTSDLGPRASTPSSQQQKQKQRSFVRVHFLPEHGFRYESLVLTSPEPPPSAAEIGPSDLVTRDLADLARDLDVFSRYRPRAQARVPRPLERGYWRVDCAAWPARLKRDTWAYLANYVGTGLAGWGVSCRRDPEFARLRVYCWGVVVPHLYLLLYLATQRQILFTGCEWIDGGGETVVVMGAREAR